MKFVTLVFQIKYFFLARGLCLVSPLIFIVYLIYFSLLVYLGQFPCHVLYNGRQRFVHGKSFDLEFIIHL